MYVSVSIYQLVEVHLRLLLLAFVQFCMNSVFLMSGVKLEKYYQGNYMRVFDCLCVGCSFTLSLDSLLLNFSFCSASISSSLAKIKCVRNTCTTRDRLTGRGLCLVCICHLLLDSQSRLWLSCLRFRYLTLSEMDCQSVDWKASWL